MSKIKYGLLLAFLSISFGSYSASVNTSATKISEINSYSNFPNGDILITVDAPHSACPGGFWLKKEDAGFDSNFSMALAAFHAQGNIIFYGDSDSVWPHSPTAYCHISQIKLVR
ncbi:MAG: hypothetical protein HRT35_16015 [Algicola sp.]|nr:hypothetical protein [Algicola sp.]